VVSFNVVQWFILVSLSRSQSLLQFVMCHIQVNGAGFAVVPDEKQSVFILPCNLYGGT